MGSNALRALVRSCRVFNLAAARSFEPEKGGEGIRMAVTERDLEQFSATFPDALLLESAHATFLDLVQQVVKQRRCGQ